MDSEFVKYRISKTRWWQTGNYTLTQHGGDQHFKIQSPVFEFRKQMKLKDSQGNQILEISAVNTWHRQFNIIENGVAVGLVKAGTTLSKRRLEVSSQKYGNYVFNSEGWGKSFVVKSGDEEVAKVSHNVWSSNDFGIAIKTDYPVAFILASCSVLVFLRQSGSM